MGFACEDEREAILSVTKNKLAAPPSHLRLRIGQTIEWLGNSSVGLTDLMGNADRPKRKAAETTLLILLADGPMSVLQLQKETKAHGDSWGTILRAKTQLGIQSIRISSGPGSYSTWVLPETAEIERRLAAIRSEQLDRLMVEIQSDSSQQPRSRQHARR